MQALIVQSVRKFLNYINIMWLMITTLNVSDVEKQWDRFGLHLLLKVLPLGFLWHMCK